MSSHGIKAQFIEPMLLLRTEMLPTGRDQVYELKFDGFRAEAIKSAGIVNLRSRNNKDFNARYPAIAKGPSPPSCLLVRIPVEPNAYSEWKPNGIPG
jgi:ATP-dependent DNA ligase